MKRIIALMLALVLVFSLAACGKQEEQPADSGAADSTPTETETVDNSAYAMDYTKYLDEDGNWLGFTAADYVTLPEDYSAVVVPGDEVAVSDEELDAQLNRILDYFAEEVEITDRAVEYGDQVNIDYVGSIDGKNFDGGSTNGFGTMVTAGSTDYIDDFLTQIIGHMPGETFNVEVTFPENYGVANLNGKDAVFETTINYIQGSKAPELTDAFVAENIKADLGVSTVAELREHFAELISDSKREQYVANYVLENCVFAEEMPESLIEYQINDMLDYYAGQASQYNMSMADFLQAYFGSSDIEALTSDEDTLNSMAEYSKQFLMMQAVSDAVSLSLDQDGLEAYLKEVSGSDDISTFLEVYDINYLMLNYRNYAVNEFLTKNSFVAKAESK